VTNALERLSKAEAWLAEAKTLDEFKEIHDVALAAQAYARAKGYGNEIEGHALEIRMVAARRYGELVPPQQGKRTDKELHQDSVKLSVSQQRLSEFRQLAKVTENTLRKAVRTLAGREDTLLSWSGAFHLAFSGTPMLQSLSNDYYTPEKYIAAVREVMGDIDLDPASCTRANKTVKAKEIYTEADDGLNQDWYGRVFLNPPYGKLGSAFAAKLYESLGSGVDEAVMLVNSRATDADWFQPCFNGVICFTDHRIDFDSPEEKATSSTHGSCFVYFGPNEEKFAAVFAQFGNVVKRWP
jgi:hypothetical protein